MGEVINFFKKKEEKNKELNDEEISYDFDKIIRNNKDNNNRIKTERTRNNSSVLRSYRIKY